MSLHLAASRGAYGEIVLLPGCPKRAQKIAETFLDDVVEVNAVRGELGFTGNWRGQRVSIQATGMGMPSMAIYAHELIYEYGVKTLVRVGTCGALQPRIAVGDLVVAMACSTN